MIRVAIYNLRLTNVRTNYDEPLPFLLCRFEMDDDLKDEICLSTANKFDHEKVKSAVGNLKLPANDDESRRLQNEM